MSRLPADLALSIGLLGLAIPGCGHTGDQDELSFGYVHGLAALREDVGALEALEAIDLTTCSRETLEFVHSQASALAVHPQAVAWNRAAGMATKSAAEMEQRFLGEVDLEHLYRESLEVSWAVGDTTGCEVWSNRLNRLTARVFQGPGRIMEATEALAGLRGELLCTQSALDRTSEASDLPSAGSASHFTLQESVLRFHRDVEECRDRVQYTELRWPAVREEGSARITFRIQVEYLSYASYFHMGLAEAGKPLTPRSKQGRSGWSLSFALSSIGRIVESESGLVLEAGTGTRNRGGFFHSGKDGRLMTLARRDGLEQGRSLDVSLEYIQEARMARIFVRDGSKDLLRTSAELSADDPGSLDLVLLFYRRANGPPDRPGRQQDVRLSEVTLHAR